MKTKPEPIKSQHDNPLGLHKRYIVMKADGSPTDPRAEYFVMRLDRHGRDPYHVRACRKGIRAYAECIAPHLPILSQELLARYPFLPEPSPQCAHEIGYDCRINGGSYESNPFSKETASWKEWNQGFMQADADELTEGETGIK